MIHTVNTMSIRQYGEMDLTNDLSILKRWYNPFPIKWFDVEVFFDEYKTIFSIESNLGKDAHRLLAHNKLMMLDRMLRVMSILMRNQNERSLFAMVFKVESKEYEGNLKFYAERVKKLTGINVIDGEGLKALQKEIERLTDKFIERYPAIDIKSIPRTDFFDAVFDTFSTMNMIYDPGMKLFEFGRLKIRADKKKQPAK